MFGDNIIDQAKIMGLFTIGPIFSLTSFSYSMQSFSSNTISETNVFTAAFHCVGFFFGGGNNKNKNVCIHLETKVNL